MLSYPITARKIIRAFPELVINEANVSVSQEVTQEVCVDGTWTETKLRRAFYTAGFKPVGDLAEMVFCNDDATIGVVCYGVGLDKRRGNQFKTYFFELQARDKRQVAKGILPSVIF